MAPVNEVLTALAELRSDLKPRLAAHEYEHDLGTAMRTEGGASAHAVRVGLRAAVPEVSHGRLAPVATMCTAILDSPTPAASRRRPGPGRARDRRPVPDPGYPIAG